MPRKPRLSIGSSFFRRGSDSTARWFGMVFRTMLGVLTPNPQNKGKVFFLDLWKWQTNGTITRPSHESRIVYWFLRICHGSILSILSLHDLNCSSFLNTKTRHTCQCRVWYFQHLHRCQDLCVDQQLGPGIGGQEPQNPELRPSQPQKKRHFTSISNIFGLQKN